MKQFTHLTVGETLFHGAEFGDLFPVLFLSPIAKGDQLSLLRFIAFIFKRLLNHHAA